MPNEKFVKSRVLIVDDHPIMRQGLAQTINDQPEMEVCGEAGTVAEARQVMEWCQPDLAIIDILLGEGSGLELIQQCRETWPDLKILVFSMHDETLFAERVLQAGALGYLNKAEPMEAFHTALQCVHSGHVYLSPRMTHRLLDQMPAKKADKQRAPIQKLSNRELEVFELIGRGLVTKQIAVRLGVSHKTIETYREHLKKKLNVDNGSQLTTHAVQWVLEQGHDSSAAVAAEIRNGVSGFD